MEKTKTVDASKMTEKLRYATPKLLDLGMVGALTQAGADTDASDGTSPS